VVRQGTTEDIVGKPAQPPFELSTLKGQTFAACPADAHLASVFADAGNEEWHAEAKDSREIFMVKPCHLKGRVEANKALASVQARRKAVLVLGLVHKELEEIRHKLSGTTLCCSLHGVYKQQVLRRHVDRLSPF
jgi:hypothetical protein